MKQMIKEIGLCCNNCNKFEVLCCLQDLNYPCINKIAINKEGFWSSNLYRIIDLLIEYHKLIYLQTYDNYRWDDEHRHGVDDIYIYLDDYDEDTYKYSLWKEKLLDGSVVWWSYDSDSESNE